MTANDNQNPNAVLPTAELVTILMADSGEQISLYEEGCLTAHEAAKAVIRKMARVLELPDQGCDGLPPNDILPESF